ARASALPNGEPWRRRAGHWYTMNPRGPSASASRRTRRATPRAAAPATSTAQTLAATIATTSAVRSVLDSSASTALATPSATNARTGNRRWRMGPEAGRVRAAVALLVAEGFHRIELGRAVGREQAEQNPRKRRRDECRGNRQRWHRGLDRRVGPDDVRERAADHETCHRADHGERGRFHEELPQNRPARRA